MKVVQNIHLQDNAHERIVPKAVYWQVQDKKKGEKEIKNRAAALLIGKISERLPVFLRST